MSFLQDITLGQYMPCDSFIHRLDPRVKFFILLVLMISVFFIEAPIKFTLMGLFVLLIITVSKISIKFVFKGIMPFIWLFLFAALTHFFFTPGHSIPPFPIGFVDVTTEGVTGGIVVTLRIFFIIVLSSMLTLTTTPMELTTAVKKIFSPLSRFKIPVNDFAMMMMLTLRFIPILLLEAQRIINAQKSRGIDFETGGLFERAKKLVPILIPLFFLSFKRADELAVAMTCRGYRTGVDRSSFRELRLSSSDLFALIVAVIIVPFLFL